MMLSKIKVITLFMFFTTIISIKAVNTIDTYCAKAWPHYSVDKKDLETMNAYIAQAEENKKKYTGSTWTMHWYDFLGTDWLKARDLEARLVSDIRARLYEGKVVSDSTYKIMDWHELKQGNLYIFEQDYAKNVTRVARKVQASLAIATLACLIVYKYRAKIAEKLKALAQRLVPKSKTSQA